MFDSSGINDRFDSQYLIFSDAVPDLFDYAVPEPVEISGP